MSKRTKQQNKAHLKVVNTASAEAPQSLLLFGAEGSLPQNGIALNGQFSGTDMLGAPTMPRPVSATAPFNPAEVRVGGDVALIFQPAQDLNPASQILGDSGSSEALRILAEATAHVKRADTLNLLKDALLAFKKGDWTGGGELALRALHVDEESGEAWHILAIARDKCNDFKTALTCYETALRLLPENPAIANDLGRLAYKMGMSDIAEKFFRFFLNKCPGNVEALNNLASALRELNKLDEAIDLLRDAITVNQTDVQLWNALGTIVNAQGDIATSIIFYQEALKFDPKHVHALYNLGNALAVNGQVEEGLTYLHKALPLFTDPMNIHTCRLSIAFCYLHLGNFEDGWDWYETRSKDDTNEAIHYLIKRPRWKKDMSLQGKRIFVSAEQGLGDEIMFATVIPDLIREVGPEGHVSIGVEPRLVPLFQKGFPQATIYKHHTTKHQGLTVRLFPDVPDWEAYDNWAIMGDFLGRYRTRLEDFPNPHTIFNPDPARVAYWKGVLGELNDLPKVGILWKSLIKHSRRDRYYSPFGQWQDILELKGLQFVNLQYGDASEELAQAEAMGLNIWTPPGIDLKNHLDELSALCMAMDCILSPANATSNIAGASGAKVWLITPENSWTCLSTRAFPWYPSFRVFFSESLMDWSPVMGRIRDALITEFNLDATDGH